MTEPRRFCRIPRAAMEADLVAGLSLGEIAERTGWSTGAIARHARGLGLASTRTGGQPERVSRELIERVVAGDIELEAAAAAAAVTVPSFWQAAKRHGIRLRGRPRFIPTSRHPGMARVIAGEASIRDALGSA